jgi:SAM-dependent methyltransferase
MNTDTIPVKYLHELDTHNLESPSIIVPYLVEKFQPRSVVDVGCGIGTFLKVFKQSGIADILGVDGTWVDRQKLLIDKDEFLETDLEKPFTLEKTYDLVLCLEVAEHLAEKSADTLVDSLSRLGKKIVFSAATSKQLGQNHLNEQEFSYWKKKFAAKGYRVVDCFRSYFWNMEKVQWWYKQNMFLLVHDSIDAAQYESAKPSFSEDNLLIHPGLYYERMAEYEKQADALRKFGAGQGGNYKLYLKLLYRSLTKSSSK